MLFLMCVIFIQTEPEVLPIAIKYMPAPSQPELVFSDGEYCFKFILNYNFFIFDTKLHKL